MKLQSEQFAEIFSRMRDHAKPVTEQDAADLVAVRAPMPPSKAHLRRIARHAAGIVFVDPPKVGKVSQKALELREANEFHKRVIADLGGSRTIAPSHDGALYNAHARGLMNYVMPIQKREACNPETDHLFMARRSLHLKHKAAMQDMMYTDYQPSLLDLIEFGA